MSGPARVLHVRREADASPESRPLGSLCADGRVRVTVCGPDDVPDSAGDVDCIVLEDDVDLTSVLRSVRRVAPAVPVVVPSADRTGDPLVFDGDRDGDGGGSLATVLDALTSGRGQSIRATVTVRDDQPGPAEYPAKVGALHDVAVDLVGCDTEAEAFERAIGAADDLLEYDQTTIYVPEDGQLVPTVVAGGGVIPEAETARFDFDQGLMGHLYPTNRSALVEDARDHEIASPTDPRIRSGISIGMGEVGVFNAISGTPGAFDEEDLALGEILVSHVQTAVERIRSDARTRRERNRLAALFENVPDSAVLAERDGDGTLRIRRVNSAFEGTFGVDRESVAGDAVTDHIGVPEGESRVDLPDGTGVVVEEIRRETADGVREFLFRGFAVDVAPERQFYAIFTDITERNEYRRELERKTERLEEFASIVSHDLRNPLSVASGWLELVADHAVEEQATAIDNLSATLERMESLIDDLLTISREGWTVEDRRELDGRRVVRQAWVGIQAPDATLDCEFEGTVEADENRLVELFENLFRNAVEHAGDGVHVRVGPLADGRGLYVADDGPGIPPEVRDSVFEMGTTSSSDGTGLGLAIVERIAEAHGWTVAATESADGGAQFEIRFDGGGSPGE